MVTNLATNLAFLRKRDNLQQSEIQDRLGFKRNTWSNWENGKNEPSISILLTICNFFNVSLVELIEKDLSNVHLNEKKGNQEKSKNVHLTVHPSVHPSDKKEAKPYKQEVHFTVEGEALNDYGNKLIPITDISVAAGSGIYAPEHVENVAAWGIPPHLIKKNATYLAVRVKGQSMAPTLQDDSQMILRLLDRSEWSKVSQKNERIYVVSDMEGKGYLKRVRNRLDKGFLVLTSDNPDKATYGNFNLKADEINTIWEAEIYISWKMPNIHDQYYSKLQNLENRFDDEMAAMEAKLNKLVKRLT